MDILRRSDLKNHEVLSGFLHKRRREGRLLGSTWQKRFFVLKNLIVSYYKNEKTGKRELEKVGSGIPWDAAGIIPVDTIKLVASPDDSEFFDIVVKSGHVFSLRAQSIESREQWVITLIKLKQEVDILLETTGSYSSKSKPKADRERTVTANFSSRAEENVYSRRSTLATPSSSKSVEEPSTAVKTAAPPVSTEPKTKQSSAPRKGVVRVPANRSRVEMFKRLRRSSVTYGAAKSKPSPKEPSLAPPPPLETCQEVIVKSQPTVKRKPPPPPDVEPSLAANDPVEAADTDKNKAEAEAPPKQSVERAALEVVAEEAPPKQSVEGAALEVVAEEAPPKQSVEGAALEVVAEEAPPKQSVEGAAVEKRPAKRATAVVAVSTEQHSHQGSLAVSFAQQPEEAHFVVCHAAVLGNAPVEGVVASDDTLEDVDVSGGGVTEHKKHWFFIDDEGTIQGPFECAAMKDWIEDGLLHLELPISCVKCPSGGLVEAPAPERFCQLQLVFPDGQWSDTATTERTQVNLEPESDDFEQQWYFLDDAGDAQGPFSQDQMKEWFDDGFFTPAHQMCCGASPDQQFFALSDLFPGGGEFVTNPAKC